MVHETGRCSRDRVLPSILRSVIAVLKFVEICPIVLARRRMVVEVHLHSCMCTFAQARSVKEFKRPPQRRTPFIWSREFQ